MERENGRTALEAWIVTGIGHGTPLKTKGTGAYGVAAPHMLNVGISSTARIAQFWEISQAGVEAGDAPGETTAMSPENAALPSRILSRRLYGSRIQRDQPHATASVDKVIEDTLGATNLME